jgi:Zn-dependent M28 family amino/carboxypeptidase
LIGAPYDPVPGSPGADDNGSALAVLLELAEAFSDVPARRPIRLVAFGLEETNRSGSRAYAQDLRQRGEPLALMISLEMLGYRDARPRSQRYPAGGLRYLYPDRGDFIGLIGNLRTLPVLWRLTRSMRRSVPCEFLPVPFRGRVLPDVRRSDHSSFWDRGYPAMMITDTANMRNPYTTGRAIESRRSISSSCRPSARGSCLRCPNCRVPRGAPLDRLGAIEIRDRDGVKDGARY